jgi:hypothetical protein
MDGRVFSLVERFVHNNLLIMLHQALSLCPGLIIIAAQALSSKWSSAISSAHDRLVLFPRGEPSDSGREVAEVSVHRDDNPSAPRREYDRSTGQTIVY